MACPNNRTSHSHFPNFSLYSLSPLPSSGMDSLGLLGNDQLDAFSSKPPGEHGPTDSQFLHSTHTFSAESSQTHTGTHTPKEVRIFSWSLSLSPPLQGLVNSISPSLSNPTCSETTPVQQQQQQQQMCQKPSPELQVFLTAVPIPHLKYPATKATALDDHSWAKAQHVVNMLFSLPTVHKKLPRHSLPLTFSSLNP